MQILTKSSLVHTPALAERDPDGPPLALDVPSGLIPIFQLDPRRLMLYDAKRQQWLGPAC